MLADRPGPRFMLADDLSGAADSSVHFARAARVRLSFPPGKSWANDLGPDTLQVCDTETRDLAPEAAAARVTAAAAELVGYWGPRSAVYKKLDSTLRGPIGAELEAVRAALGHRRVVLAPALPGQGRAVVGGRLLVEGRHAGRNIGELLAATGGGEAQPFPLEIVRSGGLAQALAAGGKRPPVAIVDSATDADLDVIAGVVAGDPALLPAGSAGLAAALARRLGSEQGAPPAPPPRERVLVVVGSTHVRAGEQLRRLLEVMPGLDVIASPEPGAELAARVKVLRGGGWGIVATGGATALAVCRALDLEAIWPRGELLQGVVWSQVGGPAEPLLVTKAGGFGGPDALLSAVRRLLGDPDG